jgi:F-box protein 25/32
MMNVNPEQSFDILKTPSLNFNVVGVLQPGDDVFPKLQNLPEECVREVLLRLADHKDLENSGKAYSVMQRLVDEQRIWRELCRFHFTPQQIGFVLQSCPPQTDWQGIYHKLRK